MSNSLFQWIPKSGVSLSLVDVVKIKALVIELKKEMIANRVEKCVKWLFSRNESVDKVRYGFSYLLLTV